MGLVGWDAARSDAVGAACWRLDSGAGGGLWLGARGRGLMEAWRLGAAHLLQWLPLPLVGVGKVEVQAAGDAQLLRRSRRRRWPLILARSGQDVGPHHTHRWALGRRLEHACDQTKAGSGFGRLALRRPLSATEHVPGCPRLRPASADQPLGPRWPATPGWWLSTAAPRCERLRSF